MQLQIICKKMRSHDLAPMIRFDACTGLFVDVRRLSVPNALPVAKDFHLGDNPPHEQ